MDDTKNSLGPPTPLLNPTDPAAAGQTPPPADPPTPTPLVPDAPPPGAPLPPMPKSPGPVISSDSEIQAPLMPPIDEPGPPMPPQPEADRPLDETPEEQQSEGGLPPVITPPSASSGPKAKLIASIIGLVLLVVSIPAGIILVGRQQDIREKAADATSCTAKGGLATTAEDCDCNRMKPEGELVQVFVCNNGERLPGAPTTRFCQPGICGGAAGSGSVGTGGAPGAVGTTGGPTGSENTGSGVGTGGAPGTGSTSGPTGNENTGSGGPTGNENTTPSPAGTGGPAPGSAPSSTCNISPDCNDSNKYCNAQKQCVPKIGVQADGIGGCCGNNGDCNTGDTCSTSNGSCASGLSCKQGVVAAAPGSVGTGGACSTQSQCANDLTCREINGVKKCRINSGLQGCCGIDSQCPSGQACVGDNGACESNKSCKPITATPTAPGSTTTTACAVTGIDVYKYPFDNAVASDKLNNNFKAGDLVRFVVRTSDDAKASRVEICEEGYSCETQAKRAAADNSQKLYRDIRLGNVGSVTIKARCSFQ